MKFQSRLLESEAAREIAGGPTSLGSFGTPTGRTWWQRVFQPVQPITDNANVNIVELGEDLVALAEGDRQLRINGVVSIYEHGAQERRGRVIGSWRTRRVP